MKQITKIARIKKKVKYSKTLEYLFEGKYKIKKYMNKKITTIIVFVVIVALGYLVFQILGGGPTYSKFSETGNFTKREGVNMLIYEKPGKPALAKELVFNKDSKCPGDSCEEANLSSMLGKRVKIKGEEKGEKVIVFSMEKAAENQAEATTRETARTWIIENSPTFNYDGQSLKFVEVRGLDLVGCKNCYEAEFSFESTRAGYGNREGEVVAQVITPHTIVIRVEDGQVASAVTDGKFNEMTGKILGEEVVYSAYFGNSNKNPNAENCETVYPVEREISGENPQRELLLKLFQGPTSEEKEDGYYSFFSKETADILKGFKVEDEIAYINLKDIRNIIPNISSSCGSQQFMAEIEQTLLQFPKVEEVYYAINGEPETFYNWIQMGCLGDACNSDAFQDIN